MTYFPLLLVLALCSKDRARDLPDKVTLHFENASITEILTEIRRQSGIEVEMDEVARQVLPNREKLTFHVREIPVRCALQLLFKPRRLVVREGRVKVLITVCDCSRLRALGR